MKIEVVNNNLEKKIQEGNEEIIELLGDIMTITATQKHLKQLETRIKNLEDQKNPQLIQLFNQPDPIINFRTIRLNSLQ